MQAIETIIAHIEQLPTEQLDAVIAVAQKELTARRDKEQLDCWNEVCRAIDAYVARYGYFDVLVNGKEELTIYKGDYAFGEVGEISICE